MLNQPGSSPTSLVQWNLQTDVGMTCGRTVKLYFEACNHHCWNVVVFGAGHVARALTQILVTLDCRVLCFDPREEWVNRLPQSPNLSTICEPDPTSRLRDLDSNAFVLCVTMGHRTDRPILEDVASQFHCPIGIDIGTNQPSAIGCGMSMQLDLSQANRPRCLRCSGSTSRDFVRPTWTAAASRLKTSPPGNPMNCRLRPGCAKFWCFEYCDRWPDRRNWWLMAADTDNAGQCEFRGRW